MNRLIIIIPGSKIKRIPLAQPLLNKFYKHFGVANFDDLWYLKFAKYLEDKNTGDIIIFEWSGGITQTISVKPASEKLAKILDTKSKLEKAQNIVIPNIRHSEFRHDRSINFNEKTMQLYELYLEILRNNL